MHTAPLCSQGFNGLAPLVALSLRKCIKRPGWRDGPWATLASNQSAPELRRRAARLGLAVATLALCPLAALAEAPVLPDLTCTAEQPALADGALRVRVRFDNRGSEAMSLPPGPYLVFYNDAEADDAMVNTARLDRVQRTAIAVPPGGQAEALYAVSPTMVGVLACNGRQPAAVAIAFYRFTQRPVFRCLLRAFPADLVPMRPDCR